ncbi:unnamed protein product [Anisakis simplex]|uniref:Uncharacterized protein n=1 Tax=Anisakis simplex TaxID=6269 RepID=A0A0M3KCC3_ANISI|nr:unnamed protein product [Anisakis simplex]
MKRTGSGRHVDEFAEILANRILETVMDKSNSPNVFHLVVNATGKSDPIVQSVSHMLVLAAEEAYVDLTEVLSLLPNSLMIEIRPGSVNALNADTGQVKPIYPQITSPAKSQDYGRRYRTRNGNGNNNTSNSNSPNVSSIRHGEKLKRRPQLRVEHHYSSTEINNQICIRPYFELERGSGVYTAKAFAATRFGSTKPKNHQRVDAGSGYHPYTTPSLNAYLQLLIFLNALACISVWSEKLEKERENLNNNEVIFS